MRSIVSFAIIVTNGCQPGTPYFVIPATHRAEVEHQTFTPVAHVGDLPVRVQQALRLLPGGNPRLADAATAPTPPHDLILLGCSSDHCIVHYEYRGLFYLVLLGMATRVLVEWEAFVPGPLGDVAAAKSVVLRPSAQ